MATPVTVPQEGPFGTPEQCPHCFSGWVFEPTEDPLEDEACQCPACLGTARKMNRAERAALRDSRFLDAHHSGLERMGS